MASSVLVQGETAWKIVCDRVENSLRPRHIVRDKTCVCVARRDFPTISAFVRSNYLPRGFTDIQGETAWKIMGLADSGVRTFANGHTSSSAPDPIRTRKLSGERPGQYWGGGPPGKPLGCCWLFAFSVSKFDKILQRFIRKKQGCADASPMLRP